MARQHMWSLVRNHHLPGLIALIAVLALSVFFFFQAEDGIRDRTVTGVQTCALQIYTLIYKGMLTADQIAPTYPDLVDPDMESALALVHQRFSTNTFPSWPLAHPYRYVAHNGEIKIGRPSCRAPLRSAEVHSARKRKR